MDFIVTKGSEFEYWAESTYNNKDDVYRCFAIKTLNNGRLIKMAQGFGSNCQGLGDELTLNNGFRRMLLTRLDRGDGTSCAFPDFVAGNNKSWKIIPRSVARAAPPGQQPRQAFFPDTHSFVLSAEVRLRLFINNNFIPLYLVFTDRGHPEVKGSSVQRSLMQALTKSWSRLLRRVNATGSTIVSMQNLMRATISSTSTWDRRRPTLSMPA